MEPIIFSNRRSTYRECFTNDGKITINKDNNLIETSTGIINITFDGIEILFFDNIFLYDFINCYENTEWKLSVEFTYDENLYKYQTEIKWINIEDIGERNYRVESGMLFNKNNNSYEKASHLEILAILSMRNIYIG